MWLYNVCGEDGDYRVVREDGSVRARRKRLRHAEEVAKCLNFGNSYPKERVQILRDHSPLHIEERETKKFPYFIVDKYGTMIKCFKYRHLAKWWLRSYQNREPVKSEVEPQGDSLRG